jgi:hypothetical protein
VQCAVNLKEIAVLLRMTNNEKQSGAKMLLHITMHAQILPQFPIKSRGGIQLLD